MFFTIAALLLVPVVAPWLKLTQRIFLFSLIIAASPISVATDSYRFGLFIYDFAVIIAVVGLMVASIYKRQISYSDLYLFGIITLIVLVATAQTITTPVDKYFYRDFRVIAYLLTVILFVKIVTFNSLTRQKVRFIIALSAASCLGYWALINLGLDIVTDSYYLENSFRYIAVSTFMSATGLAFFDRISDKQDAVWVNILLEIMLLMAIVVSGLRLLLLATISVHAFRRLRSLRESAYLVIVVAIGAGALGFSNAIHFEPVIQLTERLNEINSAQFSADFETRLSPAAFDEVTNRASDNQGFSRFVVGSGFGTTFYVPWFSYRDGKDVYNNFIDSAYVTMLAKFGLLGFIVLYLPILCFVQTLPSVSKSEVFSLLIFFSLLYVGYCLPYQIDAIGIWIVLALIYSGANTQKAPPKIINGRHLRV